MTLLFWLLWLLNLCFIFLIAYSNSFSSTRSPGLDLDHMVMIGLGAVLIGSVVVRYFIKQPKIGLWIVGMPLMFIIVAYIVEKVQKG